VSVWYAIPTANPPRAARCLKRWREMGYRTAVLLDAESCPRVRKIAAADLSVYVQRYPGWPAAVNYLALDLTVDHDATIVVTGGDDMLPDPDHAADEIAEEFLTHFGPELLGVMQPTGDPMGIDRDGVPAAARICGSPWLGRGWVGRAYNGHGPLPAGYHHYYMDEELQLVAERLGLLRQRPDLTQRHEHWTRRGCGPQTDYQRRNQLHWGADRQLFNERRAAGFPGSGLLRAEAEAVRR